MERHERRAEAGGEVGRRLRDSPLCAGDLGRVAAEEVVHRLVEGAGRGTHEKPPFYAVSRVGWGVFFFFFFFCAGASVKVCCLVAPMCTLSTSKMLGSRRR